jgi:hypothetical protein
MTKAYGWFRLYAEFATDPKVQSMPEHMQRRLVMLFCLRSGNGNATFHETELLWALRISPDELAETKALFLAKGFISETWRVTNWDKRQYVSDSSTERVRKHRERRETLQERRETVAVTPPDTDTDTDTEQKNLKPSSASSEKRSTAVAASDAWFGKEFWPLWPVARNRKAAMVAARKVKPEDRQKVVAGVKTQSARIAAMERPIHAATWINGARWEDAPDQGLFATQGVELWPGQLGGRPHPDAIIRNFKKGDFIR